VKQKKKKRKGKDLTKYRIEFKGANGATKYTTDFANVSKSLFVCNGNNHTHTHTERESKYLKNFGGAQMNPISASIT